MQDASIPRWRHAKPFSRVFMFCVMDPGEDPRQKAPYGPLLVEGDGLPHAACMQAQIEGNMPATRRGSFWKQRVSRALFLLQNRRYLGYTDVERKKFRDGPSA